MAKGRSRSRPEGGKKTRPARGVAEAQRLAPWIPAVFFLSGFSALVYQVVWQRSLFAIFGINIESVTVVVTVFMLGLPPHPSFQGISLFDPQPNPDRPVYMVVQTPLSYQTAIVRSGFKLIFDERQGYYLLYDLRRDPGETTNIASIRPDLVRTLGGRLRKWQEEQIGYYSDVYRHIKEYPPVLED